MNPVWRRFCRRCGKPIVATRLASIDAEIVRKTVERDEYAERLQAVEERLGSAREREIISRVLIIAVAAVAVGVALVWNSVIIAAVVGVIGLLIGIGYKSEEARNLALVGIGCYKNLERLRAELLQLGADRNQTDLLRRRQSADG